MSRLPLHGRGLGATIGAALGFCAALVVHQVVPRGTGTYELPVTIATALFVGTMVGLMFASIIVGGHEDDRATQAAKNAQIEQSPQAFDKGSTQATPGGPRPEAAGLAARHRP